MVATGLIQRHALGANQAVELELAPENTPEAFRQENIILVVLKLGGTPVSRRLTVPIEYGLVLGDTRTQREFLLTQQLDNIQNDFKE